MKLLQRVLIETFKPLHEGGGSGISFKANLRGGSVESFDIHDYGGGMDHVSPEIADISYFVNGEESPVTGVSIESADDVVLFHGYTRPQSILGQHLEIPAYYEDGRDGTIQLIFNEKGEQFYQDILQDPQQYEDQDEQSWWWQDMKQVYGLH